jgi:FtsP/CotA-like multicopper oxidase with cupredoxin domain
VVVPCSSSANHVWQTDVQESPIDLLGIAVAQRYSVLVTARNDTNSNWAIHANMDTNMFDKVPPKLQPSEFDDSLWRWQILMFRSRHNRVHHLQFIRVTS